MMTPTRSAVDAIGSSVCGSPTIARLTAPPAGAARTVAISDNSINAASDRHQDE